MDKRSIIFVILLSAALYFVNQWFSPKISPPTPAPTAVEEPATPSPAAVAKAERKEQFYVLENENQQLVFSTIGGSLAEINLPLLSSSHPQSVIRPIGFDHTMEKEYPANDHFPAYGYFTFNPAGGAPLFHEEGSLGGYYPLLRRSIKSATGRLLTPIAPQHYSCNIVSEDPSVAQMLFQVKRFEKDLIEFEATNDERKITKTFRFPQDASSSPYCVDLTVKIEGDGRGLALTTGLPEVELISGSASPMLKYRILRGAKSQIEKVDLPKTSVAFSSIEPDWVCSSNGFLGLILDPLSEVSNGFFANRVSGETAPTRLTLIDAQNDLYPASKYPGYEMQIPLRNSVQTTQFRLFAGPFDNTVLATVDQTLSNAKTGYNPDFKGVQSFDRWFGFISEPFSKFLFLLMNFFFTITHSWGISIILLTVALRVMLYPLNAWSIKSTVKMQLLAPEIAAIQAKNKKDPKRAQLEVMNFYREKGVNPFGGCFPMLIQMPFLIGMFDLLRSTFDLRGDSFIPGWITNLSAPDVLFSWHYPIFFFGTSFHLLPILLGAIMYLQQRLSSSLPKDKSALTEQQRNQKMMGNVMTLVFAVAFYHFPSGLNLYWLSSMGLGILQQWYTAKRMSAKKV